MCKLKHLLVCALVILSGCRTAIWGEQGPGPIIGQLSQGIPNNPVSGGVNAIAVDRVHPGTLYLATVNGGVWKALDGNSSVPTWTPLTDLQLPAQSINSIAISPLDPNTIFAGTGSTSNRGEGSPGFGVIRSIDGGATWSILARSTFSGLPINSIVPTALTTGRLAGQVVLAANLFGRGGAYRSTDGGASFNRISGSNGLPDAGVSNLVADPANNSRFYAAVPGDFGGGTAAGVYRSEDGGVTWTAVNAGLSGLTTSRRILLAVGRPTGVVYAMVIDAAGKLGEVFRTADAGATWTSMGVPPSDIFPGAQGLIQGAILAHPDNPNVVFVSGDRQDGPFVNANGCFNYSLSMFRGDASRMSPWELAVCVGAGGTSPHAGSRGMDFDTEGNLLLSNDGGLHRLESPNDPSGGRWFPLNYNLRPTEMHSAAYDSVSQVLIGGTQDNSAPTQVYPNGIIDRFRWTDILEIYEPFPAPSGGVVAVDDSEVTTRLSIRFHSFQYLRSFSRSVWQPGNILVSNSLLGLRIVLGPGTGQDLHTFDPNIQFYNPYVLNRINPRRMLIGTASTYESGDLGDTLANLGSTGKLISSLSYGGSLGGVPNPDTFYVGTRGAGAPLILHRASAGGPINELTAYPGGGVNALVMDPQNTNHIYVVDEQNRVWASFDEGATWRQLTANLASILGSARTIELFSPDPTGGNTVLLVGGMGGVAQMCDPGSTGASWSRLGDNLPHALVLDLRYNYLANVLVAAILGRGAWTLTGYF